VLAESSSVFHVILAPSESEWFEDLKKLDVVSSKISLRHRYGSNIVISNKSDGYLYKVVVAWTAGFCPSFSSAQESPRDELHLEAPSNHTYYLFNSFSYH